MSRDMNVFPAMVSVSVMVLSAIVQNAVCDLQSAGPNGATC